MAYVRVLARPNALPFRRGPLLAAAWNGWFDLLVQIGIERDPMPAVGVNLELDLANHRRVVEAVSVLECTDRRIQGSLGNCTVRRIDGERLIRASYVQSAVNAGYPPGLLSALDLSLVTGRGLYRA